jgi:hypothetical protein
MTAIETAKELVMKYFQAWQKQDYNQMRHYLLEQLEFESGLQKFEDADEFTDFCKKLPPWSSVSLLDSIFAENHAALLYEGVSQFGAKFRVAEFITLADNKIAKIQVAFSPLSSTQ